MSGIFNSGKIALLLARLTAARAAFLDAAISSRAAATTALTNATWSDARAGKLDNLDAAISSVGSAPPITSGLKGRYTSAQSAPATALTAAASAAGTYIAPSSNVSSSTFDLWTTLLNVTSSSGVITWITLNVNTNTANLDTQARLSIDGNVVYTSDANAWAGGDDADILPLVGGYAHEAIPFSTSFLLEFKITENSAGTVSMQHRTRYHITG